MSDEVRTSLSGKRSDGNTIKSTTVASPTVAATATVITKPPQTPSNPPHERIGLAELLNGEFGG